MFRKMLSVLLSTIIIVAPIASQTRTMAVLQLKGNGLSESEAEVLTNRLRSTLVNLGRFEVVDRSHMDTILREQGFQQSECTSTECAVEVGQLLGVQKMISGSVGKFGKIWTIDLNLLDVATSGIERTSTYDYYGEIENLLLEGVKVALNRLLEIEEPKAVAETTLPKTTVQPAPEPPPQVQTQPQLQTQPAEPQPQQQIAQQQQPPSQPPAPAIQQTQPQVEPKTQPQIVQQAEKKPDANIPPMKDTRKKGKKWIWIVVALAAGGAGAYFATSSGGGETANLPDASGIWPPR